jgi:hypothetical protein
MPELHRPPKNARTWLDAAGDRQVALIRCSLCGRKAHYLPEDLAKVCGEKAPCHVAPFPCSKCRTIEYMSVALTIPRAEEALGIQVRRPVRKIEKWLWRTVPLTGG